MRLLKIFTGILFVTAILSGSMITDAAKKNNDKKNDNSKNDKNDKNNNNEDPYQEIEDITRPSDYDDGDPNINDLYGEYDPEFTSKNGCQQINKDYKDTDGMPFCPPSVTEYSAASVFRCAFKQTKTWHAPTQKEKNNMYAIIEAFQKSVIKGISLETTKNIMDSVNTLGLQVCRVKDSVRNDSYLLIYTRPKVTTYSGPFLMLREKNPSNIVIIGPHDGSDGTNTDTKLGLQNSKALAVVSNGQNKAMTHNSDFVDHMNTLGAVVLRHINTFFPETICFHVHGSARDKQVLYRSRSKVMGSVYEDAIRKYTSIDKFSNFNADYVTDSICKSSYYLKTEIPAKIHMNNKNIIANIVKEFEKNDWAWKK